MIHELRQVRAFLRVAQTRNFTRAAEELHVSQSALTVQIQQLEESLGVLLFQRSKRSVTLTEAGNDVHGPLRRLLEDAESIVLHARDLACARTGTVTVAALPSIAAEMLPAVIASFSATHSGVRVKVLDVVAERVRDLVRTGVADLGIATRFGPSDGLLATPLFSDRLMVFVPVGHELAGREHIGLRDVGRYPLILPSRESSVRENVEELAHREGMMVQPQHEVNFMHTALGLVRRGLGITILPESAAGTQAVGFERIALSRRAGLRHIDLLQQANRTPAPAVEAFIRVLQQQVTPKNRALKKRVRSVDHRISRT